LQALLLFFLNGVYQDGETKPYSLPLHRLVYAGIALLPIYSAIAFYGLQLRIDQYGWTLERCWAIVVWALLAALSVAYLLAIGRRRDRWPEQLGWINIRVGLLAMIVLLATNSPLLDFRKIVVASQMSRLESGALTLQNFDYSYFRYHLALPGFEALQALKPRDADIALKIDDLYLPAGEPAAPRNDAQSLRRNLLVWPRDAQVPSSLLDEVARWSNDRVSLRVTQTSVFVIDLDRDGANDYVVSTHLDTLRIAALFRPATDGWQRFDIALKGSAKDAELAASIERGDVQVIEPQWRELQVGELRLKVVQ
jgi:hypothetical protein